MTALFSDFRTALRIFTRAPRFSLGAVLTLALGIGPVTAVFSVVYATLYEPMPYADPDRLVMVWSRTARHGQARTPQADYLEWKERATSFEYLEVYLPRDVNIVFPRGPERMRARQVSPGGHRMLGEGVWLGRDLASDEDEPGKDQVVLLTHRVWRERFDSDRNAIGRQVRIDSVPHTVIGVLPPGPQDRRVADIWRPLTRTSDWRTRPPDVNVVGRLKPGVTLEQAQQEMALIAGDIAKRRPPNVRLGVTVEPFHNNFIGANLASNLWLLLVAVGFVVLIACVNIAYLLLSRGMDRARELAVRVSLGATASQLVRLTLTESLLLALCGGAFGVLSSVWILESILALMPPFLLPTEADPRLSIPVLLFTLVVTVSTALLFGSVAAWHASRLNSNDVLKNVASHPIGRRTRRTIVLAEFSLAVTLLSGAGLTIYSFWNRINVDLGVRTDRVLTFGLTLPEQQRLTADQAGGFYDQLLERIRSLPGVAHATVTSALPFTGESMSAFGIVGRSDDDTAPKREADVEEVGSDYFETLGIPLLAGRGFTHQDRAGAVPVAVVSERLAEQFFGGRSALGQRLSLPEPAAVEPRRESPVAWQIVGVAGNVTGAQFGDPDVPKIYLPRSQRPGQVASVAVHTTSDPETVRKSVAAAVNALSPDLPLARVRTMEQLIRDRLAPDRLNVAFFAAMAVIALLLAGVGVFSAMSFRVAQQTRELGLRLAIGANRAQILRHVLGEGLALAAGGLILGLAGAYGLGRVMQSALYGVSPWSLPVWTAVAATLLATAFVACYVPARRASAVDPLVLLRAE